MNLQKHQPQQPVKKEYSKAKGISDNELKKYDILWNTEILHGKYRGFTLRYVGNRDPDYFTWLQKEGLLITWGLLADKGQKEEPKSTYNKFYASDGRIWVGLRLQEVTTTKTTTNE